MPTHISSPPPKVGLLAGPNDDAAWEVLAVVRDELARFGLVAEEQVVNLPEGDSAYLATTAGRGLCALVVASGDPALPAALSAGTPLPVIRVPVGQTKGNGALPLLWPEGETFAVAPFATVAIGTAGARNAALFVVSMLALTDEALRQRWQEFRRAQTQAVLMAILPPV